MNKSFQEHLIASASLKLLQFQVYCLYFSHPRMSQCWCKFQCQTFPPLQGSKLFSREILGNVSLLSVENGNPFRQQDTSKNRWARHSLLRRKRYLMLMQRFMSIQVSWGRHAETIETQCLPTIMTSSECCRAVKH